MIKFKTILKYYWKSIRKYRWGFFSVFGIWGVATVIADIIQPQIYRNIVETISDTQERSMVAGELTNLLILIGLTLLIYSLLYRIGDFIYAKVNTDIAREINNDAFDRLERHSYSFFADTFAGSLVAKARRYARAFYQMYFVATIRFWFVAIQFIGAMIVLSLANSLLGLFFLVWGLIYVSVSIWFNVKKRPLDLARSAADSRVTGGLADRITNILNIKSFSTSKKENESYASITKQEQIAHLREWNYANWMFVFQGLALIILEFVSMYIALQLWLQGSITTGTVVLVQLFIVIVWHGLWSIGHAIMDLNRSIADASEMVEIFETPVGIQDPRSPEKSRIKEGLIEFNEMTFHYGGNLTNVFSDFNFTIPSGQRVGLVGHSGAGKTTITKLLLRFSDVAGGSITIDGQDIRRIKQDDLRHSIAYIPQDPILFHRSLSENIGYGNPNASQEQIEDVAKKAHAHEFISSLPQGYDTLVGERGVKLSGGERQRVAIARAMLKDAPILILDEATSSLDAVSEKYIQEAFQELMKGKTTIVIAHRLSTIQKLDRIVVLEEGKIAEEGTHDELLEKKELYHNFWTHQAGGFIE